MRWYYGWQKVLQQKRNILQNILNIQKMLLWTLSVRKCEKFLMNVFNGRRKIFIVTFFQFFSPLLFFYLNTVKYGIQIHKKY